MAYGIPRAGENVAIRNVSLTDPDSSIMRKSRRDGWQHAYNARIVVDAEGSPLILGKYVMPTPGDANEIEPALASIEEQGERPTSAPPII